MEKSDLEPLANDLFIVGTTAKKRVLSYGEGAEGNSTRNVGEEDATDSPLPEGVLTVNIGVPLVVVANKVGSQKWFF